ncbi:hypothetical protein EP47_02500 [Legionella norrlandica]|uniref:Uncharacterized protein n=1 Tax=Legionella norrlandica TaxID=1498499 RepID=A0A0A2SPJ5_9GAMM|nr:hypothetical protein [Legionella norrlandica]KGP62677.1 hypothetical protein EP47_02500 [Legionella norrlandica]
MKLYNISTNKLRLTISMWPWYLLGVLLLLASVFTVGILMLEYSIVCKEKQYNLARQCILKSNIFNLYHSSTPLGELKQAVVRSGRTSKGGTTYYVDLLTDQGSVNLTGGSSSGRSEKDAAANSINNYISNSLETQFKVIYPNSWWLYALVGVFALAGIALLSLSSATIDFDKVFKTIVIKRKGLFKTSETKLLFSDVDKIIIQEYTGGKGSATYRLAIALKEKPPMPLVTAYDSSYTKKEMIANKLNEFIKES